MTEAVTLDRDRLGKLVYLHAAISETLRLYPPASLQHKQVTTTGTLPSGEKVKPGDVVIVYFFSMARMEELWGKDCREFKPERWITDRGEIKNEPAYKFFSFGSGPSMCLGRELAFTKLKTVISALLRSFRFEAVEGQVVKPKLSVISCMKNGLMVQVSKRERSW
ncbi:alkane hydroxylase MAH1-like [Canna indica]|uniref:Alkane hydroxylase MAH1-like n=1 Tax=Canna indica TaxID=4628 RepID=A0AAQ3KJR4_9LILI|nr:alkane hydroxylase MAH1-like [Canna indica]